jgi:uncharacterized membrane protein
VATLRPNLARIAPPRFLLFIAVLAAAWAAQWLWLRPVDWRDAAVMAFDLAAAIFFASLVPLLRQSGAAVMRAHSRDNDANRALVLGLTTLLTVAVMAAITGELQGARAGEWPSVAKLVGTLLLIWTFANSVYALHYAHAFYAPDGAGGDRRGLEFPDTGTPEYWDFAYFAFTLGMTFQTSDVSITAPAMRKVVLVHSFAAFVFNIGVIAFTINVLGGSS